MSSKTKFVISSIFVLPVNVLMLSMQSGVKIFGVTTHFVDETLDGGKIIDQGAIVYEGSDIEELTMLIHSIEHKLYVKTINKFINKKF